MIEQTRTHPQKTLEFKMNKQTENFSFSPPINLVQEGKWLLGVTYFECTNSVFVITNEHNSFSVTIPGHWQTESAEKTVDELNKFLGLWSLKLDVEEVRKRGKLVKIGDNEYKILDLDTRENEILEELGNAKYNDLEDSVYRFQLTYDEILDILD